MPDRLVQGEPVPLSRSLDLMKVTDLIQVKSSPKRKATDEGRSASPLG